MADEFQLQFTLKQLKPEAALAAWKATPPDALAGYALVDEAYNALTFEQRKADIVGRIMEFSMFGLGNRLVPTKSVYKVTARFESDGRFGSLVTVIGQAEAGTRAALGVLQAEHGGPTGTSFGV